MRLWTLHPQYLDAKGLVAAWREALLAQRVLSGATTGYRQHPQLQRFKRAPDPAVAITAFLHGIFEEATRRGYRFDQSKIVAPVSAAQLEATSGQLRYEWEHLLAKLQSRAPIKYQEVAVVVEPSPHPLFMIVDGPVEAWEIRRG